MALKHTPPAVTEINGYGPIPPVSAVSPIGLRTGNVPAPYFFRV